LDLGAGLKSLRPGQRQASIVAFGKKTILVLGLLGSLGSMILAPCPARAASVGAQSGKKLLETIGTGIAVGTILGASTLPFYDQPGTHAGNLLWGALFGAVAGVGVGVYQGLAGQSESFASNDRASPRSPQERIDPVLGLQTSEERFLSRRSNPSGNGLLARAPSPTAQIWMPLVSLSW